MSDERSSSDERHPKTDGGHHPPGAELHERLAVVEELTNRNAETLDQIDQKLDAMQEGQELATVRDQHKEMYFWYQVAKYGTTLALTVSASGGLLVYALQGV